MRVEWSPRAVTTASRFLDDTAGMTAVVAALDALAGDPFPAASLVSARRDRRQALMPVFGVMRVRAEVIAGEEAWPAGVPGMAVLADAIQL